MGKRNKKEQKAQLFILGLSSPQWLVLRRDSWNRTALFSVGHAVETLHYLVADLC